MALQLPTAITFETKLQGTGLDQLKRQLQGLSQQSNTTSKTLDLLYNDTKKLASAAGNSITSLNRQITAMKNLRDEAQIGSRQFRFYTTELQKLEQQQAKLTGAASGRGGIFGLMPAGLGGLAAAAGGGLAVKYVIDVGLAAENAQVRLKALADQFGEYNATVAASDRIAKALRISTTESQDAFSKLYAALRPTGITIKEIEDAYVGFTAAARASGATAEESASALLQLKQALGSGVLQGDELRSLKEEAPAAAQAIAKELGVSVGELKKLGEQGQITTDIVLKALATLKGESLSKLNAQFNTGSQALKDLQVELQKTAQGIAKAFGPTAIQLLRGFTAFVERLSDSLNLTSGAQGRVQDRTRAALQANADAARKYPGGFFRYGFQVDRYIGQRTDQLYQQYQDQRLGLNPAATDKPNAAQRQAQEQAASDRQKARDRAAQAALQDEVKIRQDAEQKLADYRLQRIQQAQDLERRLGDQRLELERSTAEARRKIAQQDADFAMEAERQRLRGAGLGTDALDTQARLNEATRRFTEQRLQIEQNATDKRIQLDRTLEDFKLETARGISKILQDAGDKLAEKMMQGAQGAAAALTGGGGALGPSTLKGGSVRGGQLSIGTLVGLAKSAGFNDKDARIMAAIAMAESGGGSGKLNNNASTGDLSYGLWQINMLGGMGPSRRRQFGIGNNDQLFDPATNALAARQVYQSQGFGAWSVFKSGAYKAFMPGAVAATPGAGVGSVVALPGLDAARGRLNRAIGANAGALGTSAAGELLGSRQSELSNITQELNAQRKSSADQLHDYQRMLELQRGGLTPELAKQRVDAENAAQAETTKLQTLRDQLVQDQQISGLTDKQKATLSDLIKGVDDRLAKQKDIVAAVNAESEAMQRLQQQQAQIKELSDGIANSIGNGIGNAFDLVLKGTENWASDLRDIAANVLRDIANQLLQIMVIQPLVKGISGGLSSLFSANGNVFDQRGMVPYAMGGIVTRPTIFPFASGGALRTGVMGEAGPEAILPLQRGSNGKLGVQAQGGGTNVVVNVDASGTNVQGDAGQGQQLGRVVAAAVQAELVKQRRPGGILAAA